MCVAVIIGSTNGVSESDLRAMARQNPHGGGLAWISGETVVYRKGLSVEEIIAMVPMLPRPFFMHFRIATKGGVSDQLTHPFPLGMQAFSDDLTGFADAVLIHNGTWYGYEPYVPHGIVKSRVSDTQVAAYVAESNPEILDRVGWSNAILRASGDDTCTIEMRGDWTEIDGNHYSNMHWQDRPAVKVYSRPIGAKFDYDDWCAWRDRHPMPVGRTHKEEKQARKAAKRARRQARLMSKTVTEGSPTEDIFDMSDRVYLDKDWNEIQEQIERDAIRIVGSDYPE